MLRVNKAYHRDEGSGKIYETEDCNRGAAAQDCVRGSQVNL